MMARCRSTTTIPGDQLGSMAVRPGLSWTWAQRLRSIGSIHFPGIERIVRRRRSSSMVLAVPPCPTPRRKLSEPRGSGLRPSTRGRWAKGACTSRQLQQRGSSWGDSVISSGAWSRSTRPNRGLFSRKLMSIPGRRRRPAGRAIGEIAPLQRVVLLLTVDPNSQVQQPEPPGALPEPACFWRGPGIRKRQDKAAAGVPA